MSFRLPKPAVKTSFLRWAEAAWEAIRSQRVIAGPGIRVRESPAGTVISAAPASRTAAAAAVAGPFCKVFRAEDEWKLLGGTVIGGEGSETIAAITIGTIGEEPEDGTFFWLACDVAAFAEDDVLLQGCDLTAAASGSGTSLPSNTLPTAVATSGQLHIALGEWMQGKFIPAGCGNIQVTHCPGTLSHIRL